MICKTPVTIVDNKAKKSAPILNTANIAIVNGSPMAKVLIDCVAVIILIYFKLSEKNETFNEIFLFNSFVFIVFYSSH